MTHVESRAFADLDPVTAYRLWALREAVFVVEQGCPYQELDGRDLEAGTRHLWVADAGRPVAYLRVLNDGDEVRVGRVLTAVTHRGRGLAAALVDAAVAEHGGAPMVLAAQSHLAAWYEGHGFTRCGADFVEDGIPHTPMRRPAGSGVPGAQASDTG